METKGFQGLAIMKILPDERVFEHLSTSLVFLGPLLAGDERIRDTLASWLYECHKTSSGGPLLLTLFLPPCPTD